MGMFKHYILDLIHLCSDEPFIQDAVEWAIKTGFIRLSYRRQDDLRLIFGEEKLNSGMIDEIIIGYRRTLSNDDHVLNAYRQGHFK